MGRLWFVLRSFLRLVGRILPHITAVGDEKQVVEVLRWILTASNVLGLTTP